MADVYSPPLQVVGFVATKRGDHDRGPQVRMRADEAALRLLADGELVRIEGPRRQEFAVLQVDDEIPRGTVVVRDVAGVAPSEVVRVRKVETELPPRNVG
jgi:anaerobic selenocysteine-containing dehydrogenase